MIGIGAGLGHVRDLGTRELSILSAIGIRDNCRFANFVLTQRQIRGARVVDVEIRVHVVLAVHCEQIRRSRQTVDGEVSVAARSVDYTPGAVFAILVMSPPALGNWATSSCV